MNHWIFIVTNHPEHQLTAQDILDQRVQDKFWGLGERTANRRWLEGGDKVVFYLGRPLKVFGGVATVAGESFELSSEQKKELSHEREFFRAEYGVFLKDIEMWVEPKQAETLVPNLEFIENKRAWGTYLQGGVRQISEGDFRKIITNALKLVSSPVSFQDTCESEHEFALEAHLEDFIDKNWAHINFGARLSRYETDEQDGRQFPAGEWSIDFLCIDQENDDIVVIELKRGRSSDSTVGQLLRYLSWVDENLAKPGQRTRGIIIAREVDEALRYSVKKLPFVTLLTYRVDFQLRPA